MNSAKKNSPKKTISLHECQKQNQKQTNKPARPVVSRTKQPTSAQSSATSKSNQPSGKERNWDKFHNPYHLVPAKKGGRIDDLCVAAFDDRQLNHVTHDRYVDNTHSGRVICRLTSETPFFVGDEQTNKKDKEGSPAEISPFRIDDKPAIPATSLRGLISNIAETASNSALRVLENKYLSRRADYKTESLSAIGMIIVEKDSSGKDVRKLRPLCLPQLKLEHSKKGYYIEPAYQRMFKRPLLKVYVDGYWKKFRDRQPVYPPEVEIKRGSFLAKKNPNSYSADKEGFWYLRLAGESHITTDKTVNATYPHESKNNDRLLGQKAAKGEEPSQKEPSQNKDEREQPGEHKKKYTRGILRVLGIDGGREKEIPTSKTHEIFIPYPEWMKEEPVFDCEDAAQHFEFLAAERTKEDINLPFHTKGSDRNTELKDKDKPETYNIKLRDGDIIFFRPDVNDPEKVAEVSISSIWRRSSGGTSHDYFRAISSELLPFNPARKTITLAEQLFGFVEQDFSSDKSQLKDRQARGLASRLRFSNAPFQHWKQGKDNGSSYYLNPVTLKILDSPKPPSPALYFKYNNGRDAYIKKQSLSPQKHHPQGRKFYLHQSNKGEKSWATDPPWATVPQPSTPCKKEDRCQQKVKITPIKDGAVFYFHIDFDNLSGIELGLLLYSLSPSNDFYHKLGMGKPIGLGTVKIEPAGLFTINRKERYSVQSVEDIFSEKRQRYNYGWMNNKEKDLIPKDIYRQEVQDYINGLKPVDYDNLRQTFADKIDKEIQEALELLGNPDNVKLDVHYPQLKGENIESENFRWFMENDNKDHRKKQYLNSKKLTKLS